MERKSYYLIILLIVFIICIGVFLYQFNNDVPTFIMVNETEVVENASFSGMLSDAYGYGVPNQTIVFHKPGYEFGTIVDVVTDDTGRFYLMQVKIIIMVILHLQEMESIKVVLMRATLL